MMEIAMVLGWVSYHSLIMTEMHQSKGRIIWPIEYVKERPFKTILSITGAVMGYVLCTEIPPDTNRIIVLSAYMAAGYSPYHVFDAISAKQKKPQKASINEVLVKQDKFKASDPTTFVRAFTKKSEE